MNIFGIFAAKAEGAFFRICFRERCVSDMDERKRKRAKWAGGAAVLLVLVGAALVLTLLLRPHGGTQTPPEGEPETTTVPGEAAAGLALSGWTILVDPGHGGYDGGARCQDSGVWEKELNLAVALETERALKALGARVVMTRREDADLCTASRPAALTRKREDMENRVEMAVENGADMVLSIHMNEYRVRSESGPQVFYREGCDSGRLLAGCVQEALIAGLSPARERVCMAGDYFILQLEQPSVLVECGFISNPAEEKLLLDAAYQARVAEAIAEGVREYVRLTGVSAAQGG